MKHTRQFFVLVLALVLTLGLCATAFADETKPGSITMTMPLTARSIPFTEFLIWIATMVTILH